MSVLHNCAYGFYDQLVIIWRSRPFIASRQCELAQDLYMCIKSSTFADIYSTFTNIFRHKYNIYGQADQT